MKSTVDILTALDILEIKYDVNTKKRNYIETDKGKIIYRFSRRYDTGDEWWTCETPERMLEVDYIVIYLDTYGIVVVPSSLLYQYGKDNDVKYLKGGRQAIRIRPEGSYPVIYNKKDDPILNLSPYFYPLDKLRLKTVR